MPSTSKSTTNYNTGPWSGVAGTILDSGVPAAKSAYDSAVNNPLIGQASGYLSDTIGGKYTDMSQNGPAIAAMNLAMKRAQGQFETIASRSGRTITSPDFGRAAAEGITTAGINPIMNAYMQERQLQQGAAGMAPGMVTSTMLPAQMYNDILAKYGSLGKSGSQTTESTSSNPMGMAGTFLSLAAAPFTGGASLAALPALTGGGAAGSAFSRGGLINGIQGDAASVPWMYG